MAYGNKNSKIKNESIDEIRFNIENKLQPDSLMGNTSVKNLQNLLNQYIYGREELTEDGILGARTNKAIREYRNLSRYWEGSSKITVDPIGTKRDYDKWMENKYKSLESKYNDSRYGTGR